MPSYRCPKCGATISADADPQGVVTCAQCGVKLRTRPAAAAPTPPAAAEPKPAPPPIPPLPVRAPAMPRPAAADRPASASTKTNGLEAVLEELHAIRAAQAEILSLLRSRPAEGSSAPANFGFGMADDDDKPPAPQARVDRRRQKTLLLIDDDPATTKATVAALNAAGVPVRTVDDGNAALAAIAADKPDVIAIENEMGGAMAGKDVINMIKATMEWVDIPIVLYTRAPISGQKEARQIHGADELVLKSEGPPALVARTIAIFRK